MILCAFDFLSVLPSDIWYFNIQDCILHPKESFTFLSISNFMLNKVKFSFSIYTPRRNDLFFVFELLRYTNVALKYSADDEMDATGEKMLTSDKLLA